MFCEYEAILPLWNNHCCYLRKDLIMKIVFLVLTPKKVVKLLGEVNMRVYKDFYEPMNLKTTLLTVKRPV